MSMCVPHSTQIFEKKIKSNNIKSNNIKIISCKNAKLYNIILSSTLCNFISSYVGGRQNPMIFYDRR